MDARKLSLLTLSELAYAKPFCNSDTQLPMVQLPHDLLRQPPLRGPNVFLILSELLLVGHGLDCQLLVDMDSLLVHLAVLVVFLVAGVGFPEVEVGGVAVFEQLGELDLDLIPHGRVIVVGLLLPLAVVAVKPLCHHVTNYYTGTILALGENLS